MVWQIIDDRSNLLGEFTDEPSALAAARDMIAAEPSVTDEIALLAFEDNGADPTALTGQQLLAAASSQTAMGGRQPA